MLDLPLLPDPTAKLGVSQPRMQRAWGRARLGFVFQDGATRLEEFYQEGCCKIRLPRVEPGRPQEAALLNTSGGITGGDQLEYGVTIGAGAEAVVTTQAAERIYRSAGGAGSVVNRLVVGSGARLDWLPQETILFDRSALDRSLEVDLAADASVLLCEAIVFGRSAMGEAVRGLSLTDRWRVRREGRLIHADGIALDGDAAEQLSGGATGSGSVAVASLVLAEAGAERLLDAVRNVLEDCAGETGASAWPGILNVRFVARSSQILRQDIRHVAEAVRHRPLPRVWHC